MSIKRLKEKFSKSSQQATSEESLLECEGSEEEEVGNSAESESLNNAEDGGQNDDSLNEGEEAVGEAADMDEAVDLDQVANRLEELSRELEASNERYLRSLAEFENFKKRAVKERSEMLKYQGEKILLDIIDVLDDFDLALEHAEQDPAELQAGVRMIHKKFVDALQKWEVRSETALGQGFDPQISEAISKIPATGGAKPGEVVSELKKPYFYKDKLIRPGQAVVAVEDGDS